MKPNISFFSTSKNGSRTIVPRGKFPLSPSANPKANPNSNPNRGGDERQLSFGEIVRIPVKNKETKDQKEIKSNRIKKK